MRIYAYTYKTVKRSLPMKTESSIRLLAGTFVLVSGALAHFVSPGWLLLAVFVAGNLVQSAFTGFCPAGTILHQLGLGDGACAVNPTDRKE
jgi:hypothetical protein